MSDVGCENADLSGSRHPPSDICHPTLPPLSFWKIAHQRIRDLKCLQVIYIQVTETVIRFENPAIGSGLRFPSNLNFISGLFFWPVGKQGGTYA
jgi:hypothetical protein